MPSKPCRLTPNLVDKAYTSAGEGASTLDTKMVLQIFQVKFLQSMDGGSVTAEAMKDLRVATDFTLMATNLSAHFIGQSMSFMVVLHWHICLTQADLKDSDHNTLLNVPVTPSGLFGDAVESVVSISMRLKSV